MQTFFFNGLTFILVAFATFLAVKRIAGHFSKKTNQSCSDGCSGCSADCQLRNVVKEQKANR